MSEEINIYKITFWANVVAKRCRTCSCISNMFWFGYSTAKDFFLKYISMLPPFHWCIRDGAVSFDDQLRNAFPEVNKSVTVSFGFLWLVGRQLKTVSLASFDVCFMILSSEKLFWCWMTTDESSRQLCQPGSVLLRFLSSVYNLWEATNSLPS